MINFETLKTSVTQRSPQESPGSHILDGRFVRSLMTSQLKKIASNLTDTQQIIPSLAVILVGDDPASHIYVRNKINLCRRIGIDSIKVELPSDVTHNALLEELHALNINPKVHGILVQMPLPKQIDVEEIILSINPLKDVDGFHPSNLGGLLMGRTTLEPCTPRGIMTLCRAYGIDFTGLQAVVVGRSMNVGRPMAQMLTRANATVTVCHRHTKQLREHVGRADLLVVATGVPHLIPGDWIKQGSVVVDVGISRMPDGSLRGDVDFAKAQDRARLISPVPGGVGPMTVATLMENTLRAVHTQHQLPLTSD